MNGAREVLVAEDPASRGGGLTKAGYGTLVLLGTNTYTGAVGRSASIHVAGEAKLGFFGENLSAANAALAGKVKWATGSALLIDTRNGPVRIPGRDLLGASVVEKTGANDRWADNSQMHRFRRCDDSAMWQNG